MISAKAKRWTLIALTAVALVAIGWVVASLRNLASENTRLATENEQMRFADERMMRSRTNFERPGITAEEIRWIHELSEDYGTDQNIIYAMRRAENGGRTLYFGANRIDPEIRKRYPPLWWQTAKATKTWNQHLNKVAINDPYLRHRTLWSFATQWNPEPDKWTESVLAYLELSKGPKGLEVTEPPSKKSPPSGGKAKGGSLKKSSKHLKEKKR